MVGVNYSDLTVTQGTADYSSHTILSLSGEYVAILENTAAENINIPHFMPMPLDYVGDPSDTYEFTTPTSDTSESKVTFTASIDKWQ